MFEHPYFSYAPNDLCKCEWKEVSGSINEKTPVDTLNFYKVYIVRKGIVVKDRLEDRRKLAELVVTYLSPSDFKIRKTGAKVIYYLKMQHLYF